MNNYNNVYVTVTLFMYVCIAMHSIYYHVHVSVCDRVCVTKLIMHVSSLCCMHDCACK